MKSNILCALLFVVAILPFNITGRICILFFAGAVYCVYKAVESYKHSVAYRNRQRLRAERQRKDNILRFNEFMHQQLKSEENCL